jgi:hypothetical protein
MLFKNSVRTSKRTPRFTITKINWLTLFKFNEEVGYKIAIIYTDAVEFLNVGKYFMKLDVRELRD